MRKLILSMFSFIRERVPPDWDSIAFLYVYNLLSLSILITDERESFPSYVTPNYMENLEVCCTRFIDRISAYERNRELLSRNVGTVDEKIH